MTINRFIPLYNTQSGAIPTASVMFDGELAVNIADGKLYTRFGDNIVALNDTSNFVSSSQQVTALIYNANIAPNSVNTNDLIVSGSAIIQSNLTVQGAISASSITGSFKGDGSQLTGIPTTLRISGSTGSDAVDLLVDDLTFGGLNGIVASVTDNTVTIDVPVGLTASLYGTASVADGIDVIFAGEFITGSDSYIIPIPSGGLSYITTASYAVTASYVIGGGGGSGTSGTSGTSGATGVSGTSGTSGINGVNGTSGTSGETGVAGTSGTSGATGASGTSGTSGESGIAGTSGTSGTSPELSSGVVSSSIQILNYNTFLTTASTSFTGSLFGTSSWAYNSLTASYALNGGGSGTSGTSGTAGTSGTSGVLPDGVLSSSQQILDYNIFATTGSNNFVGNQTVTGSFTVSGSSTFTNIGPAIFSGSVTSTDFIIGSLYGTSSWAQNAANVNYANVTNKPTLVSASSQISYTGLSNIPAGIVSTSAQVVASLPTGTVSSSTQVSNYNIFATTGSNIFKASQTITGSLYITEELVVLGSSSIQYVSQSTLNIGTNLITVNAQNPSVRFGGLAVIDSASSPRVSGSLLFDSVENQWIYVHQGTTTTSSLLIMGPETYNNLGNETHPTTNHIMKSVNDEHIGNSQITDDGTTVSIPGNLSVTGVISGSQFSGRFTGSFLGTSSLATTASYASPTGLPSGLISSSTQIVSFGTIRLTVGTTNKNSGASFYFNSNTVTAGDSASPGQDTAFLISSTGLSTVTVYLRQSAAGPNATIVGVAKNANGTAFSTATLVTSSSLSLTANTIQTYTFSGLTLNQFDSIHIYVDPTNAPSEVFGVVIVS